MTESTLNWIMVAQDHFNLEVSDDVKQLGQQMLDSEQQTYKIELTLSDQQPTINNAATSLLDYVETSLGGLSMDNLVRLVDNSSVLGYTVNETILDRLNTNKEFLPWMLKKQFKLTKALDETQALDKVIEYARLTDRLPVYLYQGQTKASVTNTNPDIVYLDSDSDPTIRPKLLVTTTTFMIGHKRARWLQSAEKVAIINNASDTTDQ